MWLGRPAVPTKSSGPTGPCRPRNTKDQLQRDAAVVWTGHVEEAPSGQSQAGGQHRGGTVGGRSLAPCSREGGDGAGRVCVPLSCVSSQEATRPHAVV